MATNLAEIVSFARRIGDLAALHPIKPALIFLPDAGGELRLTWREFDCRSNQLARLLTERGVDASALVAIGLPKSIDFFVACAAAWKLGACVLPMNARLPAPERDGMLAAAQPRLVVSEWSDLGWPSLPRPELARAEDYSTAALPDCVPKPGFAFGSGGSTGRSKVIVSQRAWAYAPGELAGGYYGAARMRLGQVQLVGGGLYHNFYFTISFYGLFEDHTLVVMERFDAAKWVDAVERYRCEWAGLVPTMMKRIIELPDISRRDLSSLAAVRHTAAPCPPWLKRAWIDLLGPEKVHEGYGGSEGFGNCRIDGVEWLAKPGSVGRPVPGCELRILDATGRDLPAGQIGLVFLRRTNPTAESSYYLGSPPAPSTADGFRTFGDLGWVDADGYLFIADRRVDMIVSGGANVYPAEVEAVLIEHPTVVDVAVVGLPDAEWGRRVHAIVQPADPAQIPAVGELDRQCRARLVAYKAPKSYSFVTELPRDEAGKIRRTALTVETPVFEVDRTR